MNIHFTDEKLFDSLKSATLVKARVGSHLYGTNGPNSDEDFLYIYATSKAELGSFIQTNHQLQYKSDGVDHNFVSLHSFMRNCVNGDSTINFEVIHSDEFLVTPLSWLKRLDRYFQTYTIVRSYNGLVKRDIKHYSKGSNDYDRKKRMGHILRGLLYTERLIEGGFNFNDVNDEFRVMFNDIVPMDHANTNRTLESLRDRADEQRLLLNSRLDGKTLGMAKHMDVDGMRLLTGELAKFMDTSYYINRQDRLENFDVSIYHNAFENWVTYEK